MRAFGLAVILSMVHLHFEFLHEDAACFANDRARGTFRHDAGDRFLACVVAPVPIAVIRVALGQFFGFTYQETE